MTPRQRFAKWFEGESRAAAADRKVSMNKLIQEAPIGRATYYSWMDTTDDRKPNLDKLRDTCEYLGISFKAALAILGESASPEASSASGIERQMKRAQAILRMKSLSDTQREKYAAMLAGYEAAYEQMIKSVIDEYEREQSAAPTEGEPDGGE